MKVLLGLMRFDVLGLAETYKWYGRKVDGVKWASGGVAVLVYKSVESSLRRSREGLVWVEL